LLQGVVERASIPLLCAVSLWACTKTEGEAPPAQAQVAAPKVQERAPDRSSAVAAASEPAIVQTADLSGVKPRAGEPMLEKLVLGIESCPLEGYQVVPSCPGMVAFAAATKDKCTTLDAPLGGKLLRNASAAVRVKTAELMAGTIEGRTAVAE